MVGGYGPGSYYPWIYLQMVFMLPLMAPVFLKLKNRYLLLLFFITICELFEIILSIVDFPEKMYRLLAIRYLFLIYLGWRWSHEKIIIDTKTIFLASLSLLATAYFAYFSFDDEPWFYNTSWKTHRWPCYYYVMTAGVFVLKKLWIKIEKNILIFNIVQLLAKSSWEIFIVQLGIIYLFKYDILSFISDAYIRYVIWMVMVWTLSIRGGVLLNKHYT